MFFIIVMHNKQGGQVQVYMHHAVAYTTEEAIASVMQHMRENEPSLYGEGRKEWICHFSNAIKAGEMETMFRNVSEAVKKIKEKEVAEKKNNVMQEIIENRDLDLLKDSKGLFNDADLKYIRERIKEK